MKLNKSLIILTLFLIIGSLNVFGLVMDIGTTIVYTTTWSNDREFGYSFYVNGSTGINIDWVTSASSVTATNCSIWNGNGSKLLYSASVSGNNATFINANLTAGNSYVVTFGSNSGSVNHRYKATASGSLPLKSGDINITSCGEQTTSWAGGDSSCYDVDKIGYTRLSAPVSNISYFDITAINKYNNLSITIFNATINGSIYSTTNGTINTGLNSTLGLFNITIQSQNIFNETYLNYNISTDLQSNLSQYPIIILTNKWNNSNLTNFSLLIDGSYYNTTSTYNYIPFNTTKTITTIATNYINTTESYNILQNTLTQINVSQSVINFSIKQLITNNSLYNNFTLKLNNTVVCNTSVTPSYSCTVYPNADTYNAQVITNNGIDFHNTNTTITITSLQNNTVDLFVHDHDIDVRAKDIRSSANISNFSVTIYSLNRTDIRNYNTTTGIINIPVIHDTYNITIDATGYALYNNSVLQTVTSNHDVNFSLYTTNSISFNIYDLITGSLFTGNTSIELDGLFNYYQYNTSNGTYYADNITSDYYKVTFSSNGYADISFYINLNDREHREINAYFQAGLGNYIFKTYDYSTLLSISNVTITMFNNVNGNLVTYQQLITDFSGSASFYLETGKEYSFTADADGYALFTGIVVPVTSTYNIYLSSNKTSFKSVFDDVYYNTLGVRSGNNANFSLVITSSSGSLSWFSVYSNYSGTVYLNNNTGSSGGGTAKISIPITSNTFNITYSFKSSLNDQVISWNTVYYIAGANVINQNNTYTSGLFNDLQSDDTGVKGLIGMVIIIILVIITYQISNSMTASAFAGAIGLGVNYYFELMPRNYLIVSLVVLIVILVADNFEGGQ